MSKGIHIVSFDNPVPPEYGGIIDVYFKCKVLKQAGWYIILHVWEYGRHHDPRISEIADEVYYYKRRKYIYGILGFHPYIIRSRTSGELKKRLIKEEYPILFEGIHTIHPLLPSGIPNRLTLVRTHNIEHRYYRGLMISSKKWWHRLFFRKEAWLLEQEEFNLVLADGLLAISRTDEKYFSTWHPQVYFLPPFHPFQYRPPLSGKGTCILYQGNLSVPENDFAAMFLVENVFAQLPEFPCVIAGSGPSRKLKKRILKYPHIRLVESPEDHEMQHWVNQAHIQLLVTFQSTGMKLKLLHALHEGRFVICNPMMTAGTGLEELVIHAETAHDMIKACRKVLDELWQPQKEREVCLSEHFSNLNSLQILENILTGIKSSRHLPED